MSWKITKINNGQHTVTLEDETDGEVMRLVIPAAHTKTSASKNEYVKSQTDARTAAKAANIVISSIKNINALYGIAIAEAIVIITLILTRRL